MRNAIAHFDQIDDLVSIRNLLDQTDDLNFIDGVFGPSDRGPSDGVFGQE
jgi:hypothetical protein